LAILLLSNCSPSANEPETPEISAARIAEATAYLAGDEMEGRGPGTAGETLATDYIAEEFRLAGAEPAGDNGYFQQVPLVSIEPSPTSTLSWRAGGAATAIAWADDFVGLSHQQQPDVSIDADVVFVGHGIVAPEFGWDDYKDADVAGRPFRPRMPNKSDASLRCVHRSSSTTSNPRASDRSVLQGPASRAGPRVELRRRSMPVRAC
jgi:hypothetical protein